MSDPWVQNIAVGVTILSAGLLINTRGVDRRHPRWWLVARAVVVAVALTSLYVAAQKFGLDGSTRSLATAFSVLWLPLLLLAFLTEPRQRRPRAEEPVATPRTPSR